MALDNPNCQYKRLRGLHNGIDFFGTAGQPVIWAGPENAVIGPIAPAGCVSCDAPPNILISYRGLFINYGHIEETAQDDNGKDFTFVKYNSTIRPGQTIGIMTPEQNHLHLGVKSSYVFYNPLFKFSKSLQFQITSRMGPYPEGYGPYSMYSFSIKNVLSNFWNTCPDYSGIEWSLTPPYYDRPQ
jgi:hypothetical protein